MFVVIISIANLHPVSSVGEEVSSMSLGLKLGEKRATIGTKSCCHSGDIMEPGLVEDVLPLGADVTPITSDSASLSLLPSL